MSLLPSAACLKWKASPGTSQSENSRCSGFVLFFPPRPLSLSSISNHWLGCSHESASLEAQLAHPRAPWTPGIRQQAALSESGAWLLPQPLCSHAHQPTPFTACHCLDPSLITYLDLLPLSSRLPASETISCRSVPSPAACRMTV